MMYLPGIFGDDLMNDFFEDDFFRVPSQQSRTGLMKTDIRKLDGEYELDIELPGYKKDDVQIELIREILRSRHRVAAKTTRRMVRARSFAASVIMVL